LTNSEFDKEFQDFIRETAPTLQSNISRQQLSLTMPKFSIDFNADLIENLQQQGIETVFSREADFSPIVGDEMGGQISISAVDHAVKLDLDENGVEGAATTAIRGIFRSIQMRRTLEITRPFYFSITNKCQDLKKKGSWTCPFANVPLFVGKVVNPVKGA
jgi:serine protease inhibitor